MLIYFSIRLVWQTEDKACRIANCFYFSLWAMWKNHYSTVLLFSRCVHLWFNKKLFLCYLAKSLLIIHAEHNFQDWSKFFSRLWSLFPILLEWFIFCARLDERSSVRGSQSFTYVHGGNKYKVNKLMKLFKNDSKALDDLCIMPNKCFASITVHGRTILIMVGWF